MSQLSKSSFISQYASGTGVFKNNSTRDITEAVIRAFSQDAGDSLMFLLNHAHESFYCVASGTNTYTATPDPAITAYADKQVFFVKFTNANTATATLNLASLGAKDIKKDGNTALASGDINAGQVLILVYDGTNFQIIGGGGGDTGLVNITSTGHGRSVGDVVINNGVTKFDASTHDPARIWGVVETVTDTNNFIVRKIQTGDVVNNLSGLTADTLYYIQDNGSISSSQTLLPIGVALGTTTIRFGLNTDLYWSIILTG